MATNLGKPLRLRNDGGAQLQLDRAGAVFSLEALASGTCGLSAGLKFPPAQVASADANTLDDYEEGVWTPALAAGTGSLGTVTYSLQVGRYVKVGSQVWMGFEINLSAFDIGTASAFVLLTGFPFARGAGDNGFGSGVVTDSLNWTTAAPNTLPRLATNNSILRYNTATGTINVPPSHIQSTSRLSGFIVIATAT